MIMTKIFITAKKYKIFLNLYLILKQLEYFQVDICITFINSIMFIRLKEGQRKNINLLEEIFI